MERDRVTNIAWACLTICLALLPSCRRVENVVYADFENFGSEGWDPALPLPFVPWPMDSIVNPGDKFDLILTVRYSPLSSLSIFPIEMSEEDENGVFATTRIDLRLRDEKGKPRGKKGISLYEYSDTLRRNFSIPDGYLIELQSLSPLENSYGLNSIGFSLLESGKQSKLQGLF